MKKLVLSVVLCAVGLTASAAVPTVPYRDFWSSHPDPRPIKDPTSSIDWGTSSMAFESLTAKHGKFLAASADAMIERYTAAIEKDPTDCEARISRALAYLKKAGENPAFDRLAKEFGYTFDNDTMHLTGELVQKKGVTPEMNDVSDEVCDILLPLMKSAYADLCVIPKNWKGEVAITPDVYPVDEAVYFDVADSFAARAILAELMCVLNMAKGFDVAMDSDKLKDTFDSINRSNGKRGVQAILENNPEFFSKVRDQKALTEAGDWWASAATNLDQWDKAQAKRPYLDDWEYSRERLHFFDQNYEKLDSNGKYGVEWCQSQSAELINLPYWASPLNYEKINGSTQQFTSFQPLFGGKFLRKDLPEFGVGVKEPWCNEPLVDTLPDSTLCGIWPSVSPIYFATYVSTRWTDIPPYTTNTTASVYGIWYKNMFTEGGIGFNNEGNPLTFAWDNATPIRLLDPEFNVRGVTAVFKGWSGVGRNGNTPITFEGKEIPTPIGEPMKYDWRRMELTANFDIPKVTYLDFDETTGKWVELTNECEIVTENTTTLTTGKVYAVAGDVTLAKRLTVLSTPESPAKLVLCDEAKLAATEGVEVAAGNALTLCGQALGTGTLEATGAEGAAGIGGDGIVTINGGTVMATGGSLSAGISGTVTINAGTVTAAGSDGAAGIGGTVTFADGTAYGVAAGTAETNALYRTAAEYAADPSAAYVALPYFSLKIPEVKEGYSYEVSSMGVQPKAALADQMNTYAIATGATARVRFTLGEDYVWTKSPKDNPMIIANLSEDTVVNAADLPKVMFVKKGSEGNPWVVGKGVEAYTNGTEFIVSGAGTIEDLSKISKEVKDGLAAITITGVTVKGAEENAFLGLDGVALTLPDGWQGELPEKGNWYGATGVTVAKWPLTVVNVRSLQRYPWNGKVDVTCDLSGAGWAELTVTVFTNGVAFIETPTLEGKTRFNLRDESEKRSVKLIWNAEADLPAGFKASGVQVKVMVRRAPPAGQLWRHGPVWAECNLGATTPVGFGILTNFYDAADAVADMLGEDWRLPSPEECKAIFENGKCDNVWVYDYNNTGVDGCLITGKGDYSGQSIFLPAAGWMFADKRSDTYFGFYWTSKEVVSGTDSKRLTIYPMSTHYEIRDTERSYGLSVRAIREEPKE